MAKLFASKEHREDIEISNEYSAIDINLYLSAGFASLYRKINDRSTTTVNSPGALISLMLSIGSDIADMTARAIKNIGRIAAFGPVGSFMNVVEATDNVIDVLLLKKKSLAHSSNSTYIGKVPNMYKVLFQNYRSADNNKAEEYKAYIEDIKAAIGVIKKKYCRKLKHPKRLSLSELHDIKLFKPEKAAAEMQTAIKYHMLHNPALYKMSESFAKWWNINVIGYLSENLQPCEK